MAFEAALRHGNPTFADHLPGAAVAAGQVVVVGDMPMVAHLDIAANVLGALAVGGGVYAAIANAAIAKGLRVWWDDATNKVTVTAGVLKAFGLTVSASAADGDEIYVLHQPGVAS